MNIQHYLFLLLLTLCGARATFAMESDSPSQKAQKKELSDTNNDQNMSREEQAKRIVEQLQKNAAAMATTVETLKSNIKSTIERQDRLAQLEHEVNAFRLELDAIDNDVRRMERQNILLGLLAFGFYYYLLSNLMFNK